MAIAFLLYHKDCTAGMPQNANANAFVCHLEQHKKQGLFAFILFPYKDEGGE